MWKETFQMSYAVELCMNVISVHFLLLKKKNAL